MFDTNLLAEQVHNLITNLDILEDKINGITGNLRKWGSDGEQVSPDSDDYQLQRMVICVKQCADRVKFLSSNLESAPVENSFIKKITELEQSIINCENITLKKNFTIVKCGGHCYDSCGWTICDFWLPHNEEGLSCCKLFNNVSKNASKSLIICDKIYGQDYKGDV
jgi:hypothetical protein